MPNAVVEKPWPESPAGQTSNRLAPASGAAAMKLTRLLVVSDTLALSLALILSEVVSSMPLRAATEPGALALLTATLPAWLVGAHLSGLYSRGGRLPGNAMAHERVNLGHLVLIGTAVCLLVALADRSDVRAREGLFTFAVSAVAFVTAGRMATRALARRCDAYAQSALIVGAGDIGQLLARKLLRHPEYGIRVVGFVDTPPTRWRPDVAHVPVLGVIDDLASIVRKFAVDRVIVAFPRNKDQDTLAFVRPLVRLNVHVDVITRMFEIVGPAAGLLDI
jgi:FlaA1/EpsC-like NDP-sugar epimerase